MLQNTGDVGKNVTSGAVVGVNDLAFTDANNGLAYAYSGTTTSPVLGLYRTTDGGATWTQVWSKSGSTLATVATATTSAFTPTASQWRAECIDITSIAAGQNKVFVMFRGINDFGNNIWVDDIAITNSVCPTSVNEVAADVTSVNLYPNPANENVNMAFNLVNSEEVTVNIYNALGALVMSENKGTMAAGTQMITINTENFANGVYMVELVTGNSKTVTRMSVNH